MSKQKIKITQKGVFLPVDGVDTEIEVGTVIDVNELPAWASNKFIVVGNEKHLNTNTDDIEALKKANESLTSRLEVVSGDLAKANETIFNLTAENTAFKKQAADDADYKLLEAQEAYKAAAGKDADKRWGIDTLREETAKLANKA